MWQFAPGGAAGLMGRTPRAKFTAFWKSAALNRVNMPTALAQMELI
jgi:hypothetical protein